MNQTLTFGRKEATTLIINMICTKIFLNFTRVSAEIGGNASWLLVIYISALAFTGFFIISSLYKNFEGKDILDIGEHCFGNTGRIGVGMIVCLFLLFINSLVLREFAENMKTISLTTSPISFVILIFMTCMVVAAYFGIEAIVRLHAILVPIIAFGYVLIVVAVLPEIDMINIFPILGNGMGNIFGKGFFFLSSFSEFIILFLIAPFIKDNSYLKKIGYSALAFSGLFLLIGAFVYICAIPYPTGTESFLPIYQLARLINYGRYVQRIESIFVVIWAAAAFLYLASNFFFIVYVFKKAFKLEYYKPLILPFAVLAFTISLLPGNLMDVVALETVFFSKFAWAITFGMTIGLLLIGRYMKKKVKMVAKNEI